MQSWPCCMSVMQRCSRSQWGSSLMSNAESTLSLSSQSYARTGQSGRPPLPLVPAPTRTRMPEQERGSREDRSCVDGCARHHGPRQCPSLCRPTNQPPSIPGPVLHPPPPMTQTDTYTKYTDTHHAGTKYTDTQAQAQTQTQTATRTHRRRHTHTRTHVQTDTCTKRHRHRRHRHTHTDTVTRHRCRHGDRHGDGHSHRHRP